MQFARQPLALAVLHLGHPARHTAEFIDAARSHQKERGLLADEVGIFQVPLVKDALIPTRAERDEANQFVLGDQRHRHLELPAFGQRPQPGRSDFGRQNAGRQAQVAGRAAVRALWGGRRHKDRFRDVTLEFAGLPGERQRVAVLARKPDGGPHQLQFIDKAPGDRTGQRRQVGVAQDAAAEVARRRGGSPVVMNDAAERPPGRGGRAPEQAGYERRDEQRSEWRPQAALWPVALADRPKP